MCNVDISGKGGRCRQRLLFFCVGTLILAGTLVGIFIGVTGSTNPVEYFVPVDPPGATEAVRWDATRGLSLLVENACEDNWNGIFEDSIHEWNKTDALNLNTRKVDYDYDCHPTLGRMKICNGDYGNTDWRGLNVAVMQFGYVVHSSARLNDFHLKQQNSRIYTMCHELGHGWGLPHTDENHNNLDRGDCMDYTRRFRFNLLPGQFNLDLLVDLYGTPTNPWTPPETVFTQNNVGGGEEEEAEGPSNGSVGENTFRPIFRPPKKEEEDEKDEKKNKKEEKEKEKKDKKKDDDRNLFLRGLATIETEKAALEEKIKIETDRCDRSFCVSDLGDGYELIVHKLMV